jgi:hypothetical protein
MGIINVKDCVNESTNNYREDNKLRNDEFLREQLYNAESAWDRLKLLRKIMKEWKVAINTLDTRDMPVDVAEGYEKVWAEMRRIEASELEVIKLGE